MFGDFRYEGFGVTGRWSRDAARSDHKCDDQDPPRRRPNHNRSRETAVNPLTAGLATKVKFWQSVHLLGAGLSAGSRRFAIGCANRVIAAAALMPCLVTQSSVLPTPSHLTNCMLGQNVIVPSIQAFSDDPVELL